MKRKHQPSPLGTLLLCCALLIGLVAPLQGQALPPDSEPALEAAAPDQAEAPVAVTQTVTFQATQDSYLSSGRPDQNFGGSVNMNLGWQAGNQNAMRMLVQFDLSSIPRNAVINSAEYRIFQSQVLPVGDRNMDFRAQFMTRSWNENSVTWNNANFLGGQSLPFGTVPGTIGWQSGSALELVRAWTSGAQANNGLLITGDELPEQNRMRVFSTRETSNRPHLIVNFTVVCDTVAPNATVSALPQFSLGTFEVRWTGQDLAPSGCQPSGIANFDIQHNINGRGWTTWRQRTSATSATFRGDAPNGAFVQFRARATDRAGNVGQFPGAQSSTTVDTEAPVAVMTPLQPFQNFSAFAVNWSGTDNLSGIATYDVQFQVNGSGWQTLIEGTTSTNYQITGAQSGDTFEFRVRATDQLGNVQSWPPNAQAQTVVLLYPLVNLQPITPPIITLQSPVTDSITLNWTGSTAPNSTLTQFQIFYTYNDQARLLWRTVTPDVLTAVFPFISLGLGDGLYTFDVIAFNNLGQSTDINSPFAESGRESTIVDHAGNIKPQQYLPLIFNSGAPE